ncbi:hypothetical protein [Kitasatospora sp. NPDC001225]
MVGAPVGGGAGGARGRRSEHRFGDCADDIEDLIADQRETTQRAAAGA